ncbi:hypothetical protein MTR67_026806 [Solanum verrucosum]|uniref:DNA/RNA polymerases superfamily protein n=1 Tax=Solanum verrucosum TaxID=315347 RepID=A0AAF0R179_SOLVR|nr:hypothetical protein MTR67_026806 [Solanum verrucosum]
MTKLAHFIPVKVSYLVEDYAKSHKGLGTRVKLSTGFHPQTDGKVEGTIQTLEDMLRACVIDFKGESSLIGTALVHEAMERVCLIRKRLKMTLSQEKSYVGVRRRDVEFNVKNWVYLKISPTNSVMRFGKKWNLSPRYVGPYHILRCIESLSINDSLSYEEVPVEILDRQVWKLRNKEVASIKVIQMNQLVEGDTWEAEADIISCYPHLFPFIPTLTLGI